MNTNENFLLSILERPQCNIFYFAILIYDILFTLDIFTYKRKWNTLYKRNILTQIEYWLIL